MFGRPCSHGTKSTVKNIKRIAAATALTTGLGLAGLGAASVAEAYPGPMPDYHWCPGQFWDPGWGNNWDWGRCHDDFYFDGDPHDRATGTATVAGTLTARVAPAGITVAPVGMSRWSGRSRLERQRPRLAH